MNTVGKKKNGMHLKYRFEICNALKEQFIKKNGSSLYVAVTCINVAAFVHILVKAYKNINRYYKFGGICVNF